MAQKAGKKTPHFPPVLSREEEMRERDRDRDRARQKPKPYGANKKGKKK